jgi:hypothetical protein
MAKRGAHEQITKDDQRPSDDEEDVSGKDQFLC